MNPAVLTPACTSESSTAHPEWYVAAMERLIEVVQELSLARDMPAIQRIVRAAARELTGADGATFVLRDGGRCFSTVEDAIAPLWKGRCYPMEVCISGWVMENRRAAVVEDIYEDPRIPADTYRPTIVRSLAMVPIRTFDPIGTIGNYWARAHSPTEAQVHLLQALADSTAMAMESVRVLSELEEHVKQRTRDLEAANEEIRQLSLIDELTGLHNRRGFFVLAQQARKAAVRLRSQVFLLFVDADGLKRVNDGLGHQAGDDLLRNLARVLKSTFRKSDIVARLGGDEFCVFGMHDEGAAEAAKARLDQNIAAFNVSHSGPYPLAASAGIWPFPPDDSCSLEDVVARADKAMYAEKSARRLR